MPLKCQQISYKYNNQQPLVISQLSTTVNMGESVVVAGANGSGKSTLLKIMAGLYRPQAGEAVVDDYPASEPGGLLPGVGLVVANPERYFFAATVEEEIAYGLQNKDRRSPAGSDQIAEILELVGLNAQFLSRNPFALSLGEQRKVGIASVLVRKPHYLLLDEPFSNLDNQGAERLAAFLADYVISGKAVVISSHRAAEVAWCQRLLVLQAGSLIYDGSMESWQQNPQRPIMLGEAAYLRYTLAAGGINIDYRDLPEEIARQIRLSLAAAGGRSDG